MMIKKNSDKFVGITQRENEDRHKKVLKFFSKYRFSTILDVGCGDGNFSILLKEACGAREVYGIEISEKGVELARKKGVKCFRLDIDEEDFPFEDNYFDAVFAGEIIEHLFDPDHFLDEVYRVLKPRGIFSLTTPNLASIYNRIALLLGYQPFLMNPSLRYPIGHLYEPLYYQEPIPGSDHIKLFTYRSLIQLLKIHNFKVIKTIGARSISKKVGFGSLINIIDMLIVRIPSLSHRLVVVCERK